MEHQPSLFDEPQPALGLVSGPAAPRPVTLALAAQSDRPLTKTQQAFNRLVAKIEKLRAKLERETRRLDAALADFGREVHPRQRRQAKLLKELVRALASFLDERRLKSRERSLLHEIIASQLDNIVGASGEQLAEEDLRALFKRVHGVSVERSEAEAFEDMKGALGEAFADFGLDPDLDDLRPDMSEAEIMAKAAEMAERWRQHEAAQAAAGEARPARAKSKRQAQKEEQARQAAELRSRSLSSIYKQLAKLLHPDLEQDPERRRRKVALMQELTVAYRHNDLHTLLRLELEWIHGEQDAAARLSDEKLGIYNQVLREQAAELEREVFFLPQQPRYQALHDLQSLFQLRVQTDAAAEAARLDSVNASIEGSLARLRSPEALLEVRESIAVYRNGPRARGV